MSDITPQVLPATGSTPAADCPFPPPPLSDVHHRQILRSAVDYAIFTSLENGCITTWTDGATRVTGWTEAEMLGQHIERLFTPEDVAAGIPQREFDNARREGRSDNERWHMRRDGSRFWAAGETLPLQRSAESGEAVGEAPEGFLTIMRDRTAQRQQALDLQFLARASDELAALSEVPVTLDKIARLAVPDFADYCAVDILQPDGTLRRVAAAHTNPAHQAALEALYERFPPDPRTRGGTWHVLTTGRPQLVPQVTREILERSVDSTERRETLQSIGLHSYIAAPLSVQGESMGVISFATADASRTYSEADLSLAVDLARRAAVALQNAKLLSALRQADRAKDVFLATLAHELRNPLAPISNGLSILKRSSGDPQRVEQVTSMIDRQVGQLSRLVDDLMDVSRISAGKLELKRQAASLVQIVSTAVEMSRPHIEAAHHQLSLVFPEEPVQVLADPARLAQVFANLLNNAAKYTRHGGHITLTLEALPSELVVRVRDDGAGIAPEMLRRVFRLFIQLPQPDERRQDGLGIGLSLVEGLVRLHGGRVEAYSAGLGKGSEFVVRLPRLPQRGDPSAAHASGPSAAGPGPEPTPPSAKRKGEDDFQPGSALEPDGHDGVAADDTAGESSPPAAEKQLLADAPASRLRRVLVVDDNVDAATTVADLLAMSGCETATVHDGTGAVDRTVEFRPDVVLLDIGLPDISGYEAARRIRQLEGVRQPVLIALTGWGQQQDKQMAAEAGFDQHWTKPVDPERLLDLARPAPAISLGDTS